MAGQAELVRDALAAINKMAELRWPPAGNFRTVSGSRAFGVHALTADIARVEP